MVELGGEGVGEATAGAGAGVGSSLPASFWRMRCMATAKSSRVNWPSCSESAISLPSKHVIFHEGRADEQQRTHQMVAMTSLGNFARPKNGTATSDRR